MAQFDLWRSSLDPERVMQVGVTHWHEQEQQQREDYLTVEEPLELRVERRSLAVIMRTPGHDHELAMGFLLTEGVIQSAADVLALEDALDEDGLPLANVLDITLRSERQAASLQSQPMAFERHFVVSASCGLCGKKSVSDLLLSTPPLTPTALQVSVATFYTLANQLRTGQAVFQHTGGLHAAGLFSSKGELLLLREDVGRHNAVDKLIGHGLLHDKFPYTEHVLLVSGRTSFEIVQKALLARIPFVAAVSAPSSLAVELAHSGGVTLIGFLRGHSMNVYTHSQRITSGVLGTDYA
ncbi:MAG: formate dehydrogenase accessory sulfurtransferase FdhD [Ktedonobacteraceae bacterium]|nr:formate dehydrogenase accessory sulfurtransferase FdhD [Ktedonobacteraceae bacterium]